ncbi:MAG: hypothetical protein Q4P30_03205 [Eubacteriales bacterium]|nr:hypothetical protein [Eubacteriales bacterium]
MRYTKKDTVLLLKSLRELGTDIIKEGAVLQDFYRAKKDMIKMLQLKRIQLTRHESMTLNLDEIISQMEETIQKDLIRFQLLFNKLHRENELLLCVEEGFLGLEVTERLLVNRLFLQNEAPEVVADRMALPVRLVRSMATEGLEKITDFVNFRMLNEPRGEL